METDNVTYIDEYRRERWLLRLEVARQSGQIAIFNTEYDQPGQLLLFPTQESGVPDDAA